MPVKKKESNPGFEIEYSSLRSEIVKRIELRQQLISITLTLAGVFLGVGLGKEGIALIYPPLAMFLAFGWAHNDFRTRILANYIRENLENSVTGLKYETIMQKRRNEAKGLESWRFVVLSHIGIFIFTQIMAILIELARVDFDVASFSLTQWILFSIDLISILIVFWIARQSRR